MHLIPLFLLLSANQYTCFYVNNFNVTAQSQLEKELKLTGTPEASRFRADKETFELLGKKYDVPSWASNIKSKLTEMFEAVSDLMGSDSKRKVGGNLLIRLKKDQTTRIWLAVYLNIFVVILVYVFITVKLLLLSMKEAELDRQRRKTESSHATYESPDFNLPLASILARPIKPSTPDMCIENPVSDFVEMAREVSEGSDFVEEVEPAIEMLQVPSTSTNTSDQQVYDKIPDMNSISEESF